MNHARSNMGIPKTSSIENSSTRPNKPNNPYAQLYLIAALALTGHDSEAHEALEQYLALPPIGARTIAGFKATLRPHADPRFLETGDRAVEGLRKADMPE